MHNARKQESVLSSMLPGAASHSEMIRIIEKLEASGVSISDLPEAYFEQYVDIICCTSVILTA